MRSAECGVWKMRSAENVKKISIFHLPILSVENEACVIWKLTNNLSFNYILIEKVYHYCELTMLTIDPFSLKAGCILAEKFRQPAHNIVVKHVDRRVVHRDDNTGATTQGR